MKSSSDSFTGLQLFFVGLAFPDKRGQKTVSHHFCGQISTVFFVILALYEKKWYLTFEELFYLICHSINIRKFKRILRTALLTLMNQDTFSDATCFR
jgi:hypothetical protein